MTLVATVRKHNGDMGKLKDWFDKLPMKYPSYVREGVRSGQFVVYSKDYGLDVLELDHHKIFYAEQQAVKDKKRK